uniref:(California timema) hypothetical protein n=1 Tax=Timema californicum TaxID=61474 RepID=A0A7R9IYY2_TIMCA|nr:unnamed protein product [Timema californicum]
MSDLLGMPGCSMSDDRCVRIRMISDLRAHQHPRTLTMAHRPRPTIFAAESNVTLVTSKLILLGSKTLAQDKQVKIKIEKCIQNEGQMVGKIDIASSENEHSSEDNDLDNLENIDMRYRESLCRLCACHVGNPVYIFGNAGKNLKLANMINCSLPISVNITDTLPKQLCSSCIDKLTICHKFAESCIEAEERLKVLSKWSSNKLIEPQRIEYPSDHHNCPLCVNGTVKVLDKAPKELEDAEEMECLVDIANYHWCNHENKTDSEEDVENENYSNDDQQGSKPKDTNFEESKDTIYICRMCGELCSTVSFSFEHSLTHAVSGNYPCILCDTNLIDRRGLEKHFLHHRSEQMTYGRELSRRGEWQRDKTYRCKICEKLFYKRERYIFHQQFHDGARENYCDICHKEYGSELLLFRHVNQIHANLALICQHCGEDFDSQYTLENHHCDENNGMYKCEQLPKMDTKEPGHKSPEEMYVCNLCETNFATQRKLSGHMRSQHGQVGSQRCIRCNTCQAIFPDISQTIMHTKTHFSGSEGGSTRVEEVCATKLFVCEYCETFFAYPEILNTHRKSHTSSKPFLCRSCPETFSNFTQADVHRRTHSNPNHLHNSSHMFTIPVVFLCEVCSRGFKLWESFHIHRLRDHEKLQESGLWFQGSDGIYECELCPDTFEQKKQLLGHIKLEHLKKKFECDECGKVLSHISGLIIHRRQHTGEKPYTCDVCGKSFRQSAGMYTHRRTHTKEHPYCCEICGQGFNVKGDLDNHRRSKHTKERPFKCPVCQKAFLTSGVFYQHRMMHAGIKKSVSTFIVCPSEKVWSIS